MLGGRTSTVHSENVTVLRKATREQLDDLKPLTPIGMSRSRFSLRRTVRFRNTSRRAN
jgi:hypothetical protein